MFVARNKKPDFRKETMVLFEKINMSDQAVAQYLGVHMMTVGRWRRGESSPEKLHFERLKNFVHGIGKGTIMTKKEATKATNVHPSNYSMDLVNIPILESIPKVSINDDLEEKVGDLLIPPWVIGGNYKDCYALRIKADTAFPKADTGDLVVIKQRVDVKPGNWVVIKTDDGFSFKKADHVLPKGSQVVGACIWMLKKI